MKAGMQSMELSIRMEAMPWDHGELGAGYKLKTILYNKVPWIEKEEEIIRYVRNIQVIHLMDHLIQSALQRM